MRYQYKPPQNSHLLNEYQKKYRVTFSNTLLTMYYKKEIDLLQINFSDESRFVLGDDKQWVWRRYGERNDTAIVSQVKFAPSVMIYAAIGMNFKSELVIVEGSIDSEKYIEKIIASKMIEDHDGSVGRGQ